MTLHLLKLCVGALSIADLESWIEETRLLHHRLGRPYRQFHTTRMIPRRITLDQPEGSLYWVIKGQIAARQKLLLIEPITDAAGIARCNLVLEPIVIPVIPRPCRPFQGWRYLEEGDAPRDLADAAETSNMPEHIRAELASLGLL